MRRPNRWPLVLRASIAALLLVSALMAASHLLAPRAHADETVRVCPSGRSAVATADTSCPFADNVAQAWYNQPGNTVYAYSPVTGLVYTMTCSGGYRSTWWTGEAKRCFGLNASGVALVVYVD